MQGLDIADLANYHHELLSSASVKVGVFGNVSREAGVGAFWPAFWALHEGLSGLFCVIVGWDWMGG